jgi:hypothetical protein
VPHTTSRAGRTCAGCHLEPQALGYGSGVLSVVQEGPAWRWRLESTYQAARSDSLPADAWIGLLGAEPAYSTRAEARPLSLEEQRRVLSAGACLGCHDPASAAGKALYARFAESLLRAGPLCRVP